MSPSDDPHKAREASKYDKPVASREFIAQALTDANEPMTLEALGIHFDYQPDTDEFEGLRRRVGAMQRDGQLLTNRTGAFIPLDEASLIAGRIQAHSDGFGFLIADEGDEDIYLNGKQMRQVLHGDRVLVTITGTDRRGRQEGRIIKVVERAHKTLVGRFVDEQGAFHVSPDNKRIHLDVTVPAGGRKNAQTGDIVVVELTEQPTRRNSPVGNVIEVLGKELKAGMEIDVALRSHDIPHVWPDEVTAQADGYGAKVREEDIPGRKDVRTLPLMTIDGSDARDFDDAVYAERTDKGFRLLVAIADVASYVQPGSALDKEATNRGTSVYFPGQVVPMLPEVLSNGLCSLNPDVDRLCMLCELTLDAAGGIKRTRFFNAVMRSHARLTYDQAWEMLSNSDSKLRSKHAEVVEGLDTLYALYKVLRAARDKRGVIEFESNETRIVFDENRKIQELLPVHRNDAHKLIEECMILANISAAAFIERQEIPALYRVHQGPKSDRLEDLRSFLGFRGLTLGGGDSPTPIEYARLSKLIVGRADRSLIETTMLRSMQQAVYQSKNEGHFGLALTQYAHFTSPIRRYPDLLVHRAIKFSLTRKEVEQYDYTMADMQTLGQSCSTTERRAEEASRDVLSWLKCEYMQSRVGEEFDGIVSTVTSFGLFVELNNLHVEGLVHITSLVKDYYRFEQAEGALIGEKSGRQYHLGEPIRIRVAAVNLDDRKIDFQEVDTGPRLRKEKKGSDTMDPSVRQKKPKKSKSQLRRNKQRQKARDEEQANVPPSQRVETKPKAAPTTKPEKADAQKKREQWKKGDREKTAEPQKKHAAYDKSKARQKPSEADKPVTRKQPPDVWKKARENSRSSGDDSAEDRSTKPASKKVAPEKVDTKKAETAKVSSKKVTSKRAAAKSPVSKKVASKNVASKKVTSKSAAVKSPVSKKVTSKKVATKKASSKKAASKKAASKKVDSKKSKTKATTTKKQSSKKAASKKTSKKASKKSSKKVSKK